MRYFADLHIHSYFSRATSRQLNLEHLHMWGQLKGLQVIATGDITHPQWLEEMQTKLKEAEPGLYQLKQDFVNTTQSQVPKACQQDIRFILSGEISTIYKKNGRVRKVHSVVFMPSLQAVESFQATLDKIGNIRSDGRPILGLDTRDLLEIVLETDCRAQFIPAHIWTPWFSLFGSKSGFDTIEECFDDLTNHIFALETGLSSDPPMNWRLSALDPYTLVSNSDAHSPAKLAREANLFQTDLSYDSLFSALKNKKSDAFWGTIEFFPEEGKYHMDGHRKCNMRMEPSESIANDNLCPVCKKPATLGVSHRVEELADRPKGYQPESAKQFKSLIPLPEVLSEVVGTGPNSKRVQTRFFTMLDSQGSELAILMDMPLEDIERSSGPIVAEAVRRMRHGEVHPQGGYDGEFGIIRIFNPEEKKEIAQQGALFAVSNQDTPKSATQKEKPPVHQNTLPMQKAVKEQPPEYGLNEEQEQAISHRGDPLIIKAGPGTGKTRTLTRRLAALTESSQIQASDILAITFTNKAAQEMQSRLHTLVGEQSDAMTIRTFHSFGAELLRQREYFFKRDSYFTIIDPQSNSSFLETVSLRTGKTVSRAVLERIAIAKSQGYQPDSIAKDVLEKQPANFLTTFQAYETALAEWNAVDFEDLILLPFQLLSQDPELRRSYLDTYPIIAVDEFQDINQAQYNLFRLFAFAAKDVCVIGDPDQAIYGFRGASASFFRQFTRDFPHARSIQLTRNYRSAQNIVSASLQMLGRAEHKSLWSNLAPEVKVTIETCATDRAEAEYVVHQIEQIIGGTAFFSMDSNRVDDRENHGDFSFGDIAILLRSRQLAAPLTEALQRSGIPFETIHNHTIYNEPVAQVLITLLHQLDKKDNSIAAWQNSLDFFIPQNNRLQTLIREMHDKNLDSLWQSFPDEKDVIRMKEFTQDFSSLDPTISLQDLITWLLQRLPEESSDKSQAILKRIMPLARLYNDDRQAFHDTLMLHLDKDLADIKADRVHVLTMHASKGLEFSVVFIVGLEDGISPFQLKGQPMDVDEERRLLYVAMTRAEKQLYLTHAKYRYWYSKRQKQQPSPFLAPISEEVVQRNEQHIHKQKSNQLSLF